MRHRRGRGHGHRLPVVRNRPRAITSLLAQHSSVVPGDSVLRMRREVRRHVGEGGVVLRLAVEAERRPASLVEVLGQGLRSSHCRRGATGSGPAARRRPLHAAPSRPPSRAGRRGARRTDAGDPQPGTPGASEPERTSRSTFPHARSPPRPSPHFVSAGRCPASTRSSSPSKRSPIARSSVSSRSELTSENWTIVVPRRMRVKESPTCWPFTVML